ncbi:MAG: hypothetical protein WCJ37_05830 [Syntrophus sp. (in: bacteria)]
MVSKSCLVVSTPWSKLSLRMMDPLGFQWIADRIADELVPGITSRQYDGRWLTLLCKGLSGIRSTDDEERYERMSQWERGILIFAKTKGVDKGRQLPGQKLASTGWPRRYRFYGPYGSYRSLLISARLTDDDGWTLTEDGWKLAELVPWKVNFWGDKPVKLAECNDPRWLPRREGEPIKQREVQILQLKIFGTDDNGQCRLATLRTLGNLWDKHPHFGWFDRFTMECLTVFAEALEATTPGKEVRIPQHDFGPILKAMPNLPNADWKIVADLASSLRQEGVKALLQHHAGLSSTGRRWLERSGSSYIRVSTSKVRSAYNYRFKALWRLGSQLQPKIAGSEYPLYDTDSKEVSDE